MRHDLAGVCVALAVVAGAMSCGQGEQGRERDAAMRARRGAAVRETETVTRVATPRDSGRIIYDSPPDLSEATLIRTRAPIVGLDKPLPPITPAPHPAKQAP